jgi:predicted membrane protein
MEKDSFRSELEHEIMKAQKSHRRGKIAGGLLIILFGVLYLLKQLKVDVPDYLLSWPVIIIGIGLVVLIKHKFRKLHGYFFILIGGFFLFASWYPDIINKKLIWPILIILFGIAFLFSSNRKKKCRNHARFSKENWRDIHRMHESATTFNEEDFIDSVSFFGGITKTVVSKNFKGADIVSIFGGTEVNLVQADFDQRIVFDITNLFGGTTLTIPNNWQVISEVATVFGGYEDKRPEYIPQPDEPKKILVLRGTCMFGGIELNSYAK